VGASAHGHIFDQSVLLLCAVVVCCCCCVCSACCEISGVDASDGCSQPGTGAPWATYIQAVMSHGILPVSLSSATRLLCTACITGCVAVLCNTAAVHSMHHRLCQAHEQGKLDGGQSCTTGKHARLSGIQQQSMCRAHVYHRRRTLRCLVLLTFVSPHCTCLVYVCMSLPPTGDVGVCHRQLS
jgi:hypothetical protein